MNIPEGVFVFTSDREEVGTVTGTSAASLTVRLREPEAVVTLPRSCASHITTGALELTIDAATLRENYLDADTASKWPRRNTPPVDDSYVPEDVVAAFWEALPERNWAALERLALAEDGRAERRFEAGHLNDVVLVSREMHARDAAFPRGRDELTEVLNRAAAALPHETSGE